MSSREKKLQKTTIKRMKKDVLWEQVRQSKRTIKKEGIVTTIILSLIILCGIGAIIYFNSALPLGAFIAILALIGVLSFIIGLVLLKMVSGLYKIDKELKRAGVDYKTLKKEFSKKK